MFGGDDDKQAQRPESAAATATATASATPQAVGQIALKGTGAASKAHGVFALFLQGQQQLLFAVQMQDMPATPKGAKYALWLSGPGNKAKWIGDTPDVAKDGVLQVQGPRQQDTTFSKDVGNYRQVLLTQERGDSREQARHDARPRHPAARLGREQLAGVHDPGRVAALLEHAQHVVAERARSRQAATARGRRRPRGGG